MTKIIVSTTATRDFRQELENKKKEVFLAAFKYAGGNTSKVAQLVGYSRGTTTSYLQRVFGKNYKQEILNRVV